MFDGVISAAAIADIDADTLFEIFTHKQRDIDTKSDIIEKKSAVIEQLKQRIQRLEDYLRLEKARRFGPSSEKNSNQLELLFNEAETLEESAAVETAIDALQETTGTPKNHPHQHGQLGHSFSGRDTAFNQSDAGSSTGLRLPAFSSPEDGTGKVKILYADLEHQC
jgi:hypothetical protein